MASKIERKRERKARKKAERLRELRRVIEEFSVDWETENEKQRLESDEIAWKRDAKKFFEYDPTWTSD